ncbi:helix-turn-helix domain-containing protein [Carboxylicivirga sp. RSCT41]|uniref:helix-turn-helix domain-containing protein n=1 Tax=Carboxylicivirga agarovorans TaxID=3417570 RepID=UPI003D325829
MDSKKQNLFNTKDPLLTIAEATDYLRVSRATIYNMHSEGRLKMVGVGGKRFIRLSELEKQIVELR